ncbi:MAG: sodium:solute symporter [Chthoniobacteraceae bacterium]
MNGLGLDLAVIVAYFALILGIGLYKGRGERTMEGFAVAHRSIPWWAVLASILASEVSAGTFLGTPGEGYGLRNFTYVQLAIGTILARIIVAYLFIGRFYELKVVSIYEFLEARFGRSTKLASSTVFLITRALASGSRMFVPAILLVCAWEMIKDVHPDPAQTLWFYVGAVGVLVLLTAIYTTFGGIKAVVWTDLIQVLLMYGAMLYALFTLWHAVGGWSVVQEQTHRVLPATTATGQLAQQQIAAKALTFWDTGFVAGGSLWANIKSVLETEYTIFSAFLASVFVTMATHGTDQDMVQRMLTAPDVRRSRRSLILSGLADIPVALCFTFIGILLWVYHQLPAHAGRRPESDYFVNYILHEMPPGIRGLMAAGLFATAMGSLSTALNALATAFTRDFYLGIFRPAAGGHEQMIAARWATAIFAFVLAAIGVGTAWVKLTHPEVRIIPIVLGSFGYTYGSLLGIFLVGMTTRTRGSNAGNLLAMLAGFLATAVLSNLPNDAASLFGAHLYTPPTWLPIIEFPWRIMAGTLVTFAVALCFQTTQPRVAQPKN